MTDGMYRIGIVGATTLAGKELNDELQDSLLGASEFVLLDEDEEAAGMLTAAGDEPAFIHRIDASSFEKMDFVFFVGDAAGTKKFWQQARRSGASLIDLTYALDGEKNVLVRSPLLGAGAAGGPDLKTPAVVAAHPAAVMLALVAARLKAKLSVASLAATVMEPASEHGKAAMDELHQQTVNLLSFHAVPKEQYDAQVSFNLLPTLGDAAKIDLGAIEQRIQAHYGALISAAPELALQLVQAPVFHGYAASVLVELEQAATVEQVEAALVGEWIEVVSGESDPPSNVSAAGQSKVMVRVRAVGGAAGESKRFWLWLAADNLKLGAVNAIACALELRRLRPSGKVQ